MKAGSKKSGFAPLFWDAWEASELLTNHRPHHAHPNKALLLEMALAEGASPAGTVTLSRWPALSLPASIGQPATSFNIEATLGHFGYAPTYQAETMEWHLNFADRDAFATWKTSLFAQDEIQVAEHPALAAMHLMAREQNISMRTVDETPENSRPTPVLVSGVERRIEVETTSSGLYGNAFQRAPLEQVRHATRKIDPPTISNILAIQAPEPGVGIYTAGDVRQILVTAYSGFAAAIEESRLQLGPDFATSIHTGFWGCGAYGGNRSLMLLLQMLAAHLAGAYEIVFHLGKDSGRRHYEEALELYQQIVRKPKTAVASIIARLEEAAFPWGVSDGN